MMDEPNSSIVLLNLVSEEPFQQKRQDKQDMTHIHGPYSWWQLALASQVFEYSAQIGCYRDQAVVNSPETAYQTYYCIYMHICKSIAYIAPLPIWPRCVCEDVPEPCLQFACRSPFNLQEQFYNLQKCSQYGPDDCHYDTQVDGMHAITHEHLVHTKVCYKPKRIENQVCTTLGTGFLIM